MWPPADRRSFAQPLVRVATSAPLTIRLPHVRFVRVPASPRLTAPFDFRDTRARFHAHGFAQREPVFARWFCSSRSPGSTAGSPCPRLTTLYLLPCADFFDSFAHASGIRTAARFDSAGSPDALRAFQRRFSSGVPRRSSGASRFLSSSGRHGHRFADASALPSLFFAVTLHESDWPASAFSTRCVLPVAPDISTPPRSHWNLNVNGWLPVHVTFRACQRFADRSAHRALRGAFVFFGGFPGTFTPFSLSAVAAPAGSFAVTLHAGVCVSSSPTIVYSLARRAPYRFRFPDTTCM